MIDLRSTLKTVLPGATVVPNVSEKMMGKMDTPFKNPEHKLVRTDSKSRTLDVFLSQKASPSPALHSQMIDDSPNMEIAFDHPFLSSTEIVDVQLTSVIELREELEAIEHSGITEMLREHSFVGLVDTKLALIQHQTKLMMVDYHNIRYITLPRLTL